MVNLNNSLKISSNTVVHCPTEILANKVLSIADECCYRWDDGTRFISDNNNWMAYKERTCYDLFKGFYSSKIYYLEKEYDIISAEDFIKLHDYENMSPKEILFDTITKCKELRKEGCYRIVVVKTNSCGNYICLDGHTLLHSVKGYMSIDTYGDDLIIPHFPECNIDEIWKIMMNERIGEIDEDNSVNELIWKRDNINEITLDDIAKRFGVDVTTIRIIK